MAFFRAGIPKLVARREEPEEAATVRKPRVPPPRSPITGGDRVELVTNIPAAHVVRLYKEQLGLDVFHALRGISQVALWRCEATGYLFFTPFGLAGDDAFYRRLGKENWYYLESKWEHRFVASHLHAGARVLEVGSGPGAFLELLRGRGSEGIGLEWNEHAIASGQARGLDVRAEQLAHVAAKQPGSFDAVCLFQVLEHVADVRGFLRQCLRTLLPGGLLCIAVPDQGSFVGRLELALDLPPHHMGRWTLASLQALTEHLPLDVVALRTEPLQRAHLKGYWSELLQRRCKRPAARLRRVTRWTFPLVRPCLELARFALRGHSAVAIYQSRAEDR